MLAGFQPRWPRLTTTASMLSGRMAPTRMSGPRTFFTQSRAYMDWWMVRGLTLRASMEVRQSDVHSLRVGPLDSGMALARRGMDTSLRVRHPMVGPRFVVTSDPRQVVCLAESVAPTAVEVVS